jgi:ferric-dicitrate binding protein FerR (iron transport regulator)
MRPEESGAQRAERLARRLAQTINDQGDRDTWAPIDRAFSFESVARRWARARSWRLARYFFMAAVGATLATAAVGFWIRPKGSIPRPEALTYTVNGDAPPGSGYIVAAIAAESELSFSDGTRIRLASRASGRVLQLSRHGARIALEGGRAKVEVAHRPGAEWLFEAGPFLITVHGTAFSLGWNARDSRLDVEMRSGVVSVTGPLSGEEILLRAGQTLSLSMNDEKTFKSDSSPEIAPPTSIAVTPASPVPTTGAPTQTPVVRPLITRHVDQDWETRLANGHASSIVADAKRRGLSRILDDSGSEDLAALADAARFERNEDLARRALLAQRRRFPGSTRAAEASFLLGRLDDASDKGSDRALDRYDEYLQEAPEGVYVSEAMGRKMRVLERAGRSAEAIRIAADYLRRFPRGSYSPAARALVREP